MDFKDTLQQLGLVNLRSKEADKYYRWALKSFIDGNLLYNYTSVKELLGYYKLYLEESLLEEGAGRLFENPKKSGLYLKIDEREYNGDYNNTDLMENILKKQMFKPVGYLLPYIELKGFKGIVDNYVYVSGGVKPDVELLGTVVNSKEEFKNEIVGIAEKLDSSFVQEYRLLKDGIYKLESILINIFKHMYSKLGEIDGMFNRYKNLLKNKGIDGLILYTKYFKKQNDYIYSLNNSEGSILFSIYNLKDLKFKNGIVNSNIKELFNRYHGKIKNLKSNIPGTNNNFIIKLKQFDILLDGNAYKDYKVQSLVL